MKCYLTWRELGTPAGRLSFQLVPWLPDIGELALGLLPTPTAADANSSGSRNTPQSKANAGLSLTDVIRSDQGTGRKVSAPGRTKRPGLLNPAWIEFLMGFPTGFTELEHSEIRSFRKSRRKSSSQSSQSKRKPTEPETMTEKDDTITAGEATSIMQNLRRVPPMAGTATTIADYQPAAEGETFILPPGITRGVPAELYHRDAGSVSKSTLFDMRISAAHCQHRMLNPKPPTDEMIFGTVVDFLTYTPEASPPFVISAYDKWTTKESREWRDAQVLPIISSKDFDAAHLALESMMRNENFAESFQSGESQLCAKAQLPCCSLADLHLRCRPDFVPLNKPYLVDLKTTGFGMGRQEVFEKVADDKGYHVQAALYLDIWNALNPHDQRWAFKFHVVEREAPFATSTLYYEIGTETMIAGTRDYQRFLAAFEKCLLSGEWPGYPTESIRASLPAWKLNRLRNALP